MKKSFVAITEMWGKVEIEYSRTFDLFGITFAIHRPHSDLLNKVYVVSEIKSGMRACPTYFNTMAQTKKEATKFLEDKGEKAIKKAIAKGKRINTLTLKKLKSA